MAFDERISVTVQDHPCDVGACDIGPTASHLGATGDRVRAVVHWRRWLTAVVLVGLSVAVFRHRSEALQAISDITAMSTGWKLALLTLAAAGIAANGLAVRSVTPGLSVTNAVMVHQATTAANNSIVGSGPVNLGLRIAMLRSWGVGASTIGVTVVALNVVAAYRTWAVALVIAMLGTSGAAGNVIDPRLFPLVATAAVGVLVVSTLWWWIVLRFPVLSGWMARRAQRLADRARKRTRRVPDVNVPAFVESIREEGRRLVRTRGRAIVAATVIEQAVFVVTPVAVVRAVGIDSATISTAQILITFGVVRLAAALTPIPGGIGITELGLAALLIRFGGPEPAVVAAVLTFRSITFLLPLMTGGVCLAAWRWSGRARSDRRDRPRSTQRGVVPRGAALGDSVSISAG
jgi:putative heme transporter